MAASMAGAVDAVDSFMDRLNKLLKKSADIDPDIQILADDVHVLERPINKAIAAAEELDDNARKAARQ